MPTTVLQPDETTALDAEMQSLNVLTNYGTGPMHTGKNEAGTNVYRCLLKFAGITDGTLPHGAKIDTVTLRLTISGNGSSYDGAVHLYRCLRPWGEMTENWTKYDGVNNWTTLGAEGIGTDRESTVRGACNVPKGSVLVAFDISIDVASVQDWLDGRLANNGWLMRNNSESANMIVIRDSGDATPAYRPRLTITWHPIGSLLAFF